MKFNKENYKNENCKYAERARWRGPGTYTPAPKDPRNRWVAGRHCLRITSSIEHGIALDLDAKRHHDGPAACGAHRVVAPLVVTVIGYARRRKRTVVASDAICRTGPSF